MKKIAITMGDPGGIGPEIVLMSLLSPLVRKCCSPVVIGDLSVMHETIDLLKLPLKIRAVDTPDDSRDSGKTIDLIDLAACRMIPAHRPTARGGNASVSYVKKAVALALSKKVDGIVTAPISKEALKIAGFRWPGHTEMIAELTRTKDYAMMLTGGPLRVILVTIHTALKLVPSLITTQKVARTLRLAHRACTMLGIKKPRIAVAGLNPHAGEKGMFGDEEMKIIIPAVRRAAREGIPISGPYPPDTLFHKAYKGEVDMVVCMYHDQGLIPLKMIAFDKGVNVTVGLPFVRTSPDHGTAYDIAGKGIADPSSMIEAIMLAARLRV
ncbi:MAG: 4-hydroxythreonine-4-phosphate dehydrogenase PdxA [Nitrospirota bacterium]